VALKVLPFSSALNELSVLRFRNEAQVLAQLDHPNIVPVFDTGQFNGSSFLAMKLGVISSGRRNKLFWFVF
jgi:serine/threonine protein kinase